MDRPIPRAIIVLLSFGFFVWFTSGLINPRDASQKCVGEEYAIRNIMPECQGKEIK